MTVLTHTVEDHARPGEWLVRSRVLLAVLLAAGLAGVAAQVMPGDSPMASLMGMLGVSVAIMVVPGAAVLLAWRPRDSFTVIESLAFSIAVSFGLIQMLTLVALTFHVAPSSILVVLAVVTLGHLYVAATEKNGRVLLRMDRGQLIVCALAGMLGLFLYAAGSPVGAGEDRIHVALVQRLVHLQSPAIENIYFAPGVTYTYPFPGTHYMLALMSRIGGIEPIFLYHKLRAFWGVAAIILLYGCAKALFESARVAAASAVVAALLVANGTFAAVPGMYWAQMAPYSHASDVAMGVLLPALLLLAFAFVQSSGRRESLFFLVASLVMAFMLCAAHTREIVQFEVYLAACLTALALTAGSRGTLVRTAILLVATTATLLAYGLWHEQAVPAVTLLERVELAQVRDMWNGATWAELFGSPLPMLRDYLEAFPSMFYGWNALVLLASPLVLYAFRRRPLSWLLSASIVAYVLIIRFPVLGMPYIRMTYHEILFTPVRNVVFFIHMLAGVCLYLIAVRLARYGYLILTAGALLAAFAIIAAQPFVAATMARRSDLLFMTLLVAYGLLLVQTWRTRARPGSTDWIDEPHPRWALAFALLLAPILVQTRVPESMVLGAWRNAQPTPQALMGGAPPPGLIRLAREEISTDAVLAVDARDDWQPALFMPQQMVVWPGHMDGLVEPERMFPKYYEHQERAEREYHDQPFFNPHETPEERLAFLRDTGATHVLVSPRTYAMMSNVLGRDPNVYRPRYDQGMWALYEVRR